MTEQATVDTDGLEAMRGGVGLRMRLVEILGEVRGESVDALWAEALTLDCQLEMDSKEAEVVLGRLEFEADRELAKPEDLEPEQLATIEAVAILVERSLGVPAGSEIGGG